MGRIAPISRSSQGCVNTLIIGLEAKQSKQARTELLSFGPSLNTQSYIKNFFGGKVFLHFGLLG